MEKFLLLICLLIQFWSAVASEGKVSNFRVDRKYNDTFKEYIKEYQWSFTIHVVHPIYVYIQIPRNFKYVTRPEVSFKEDPIKEFSPQHESVANGVWSELITLVNLLYRDPDHGKKSFSLIEKKGLATGGAVLKKFSFGNHRFDRSMMIMVYNDHNRREIMGSIYFCGPLDYVELQYAVALKKGETEVKVAKQVENFLLTYSRVFRVNDKMNR